MRRYIPALILPDKKPIETENNFHFDMHIYNNGTVSTVFQIPVKYIPIPPLKDTFNDKAQAAPRESYFPRLRYENKFIESECSFARIPVTSSIHAYASANRKSNGAVNIALKRKPRATDTDHAELG